MARKMSNAQAGLPQPARADLLAPDGGARNTRNTRETVAAGASFYVFWMHIAYSQDKERISHECTRESLVDGARRAGRDASAGRTPRRSWWLGRADAQQLT